jgi:uncharacterized protein
MPTALELTRTGWQSYLRAASRRPPLPALPLEMQRDREERLIRVRRAARVLKEEFGARRVVLFGSLAHQAWFAADSDVDLAVEGLLAEHYWDAWRAVEDIVADRPVDLIEIESASPSLLESVERHGVEL